MSLVSQISALATRIATEINAVRQEIPEVSGNLDGGKANSVYGGISPIVGGNASN